ncbi:LYR motif-containing protein 4 isoform X2 [Choloepus didactylus]|uniref:LYR motif-containing protein 4 isoform X2 n=1 Tax=Choloepus didactylus TaxID=27675 RepID=UPI0018A1167A|nr:LYR motif-containing protein 4 isoform X2 [Choloepus didactylus]
MAASSRAQVLDLYRAMLRESKHFSAYNYRTYALRRIRDAFRENKNVKDPVEIQTLVNKAKRDLGIIRRQTFIKGMKTPRESEPWKQEAESKKAPEGEGRDQQTPPCALPFTEESRIASSQSSGRKHHLEGCLYLDIFLSLKT